MLFSEFCRDRKDFFKVKPVMDNFVCVWFVVSSIYRLARSRTRTYSMVSLVVNVAESACGKTSSRYCARRHLWISPPGTHSDHKMRITKRCSLADSGAATFTTQ